jgi:hypothetical protein
MFTWLARKANQMGGSVVHYVVNSPDVIEWATVNLSHTSSDILWQTFNCSPAGSAQTAIRKELSNRGEF